MGSWSYLKTIVPFTLQPTATTRRFFTQYGYKIIVLAPRSDNDMPALPIPLILSVMHVPLSKKS